jgi:hypothetical protein
LTDGEAARLAVMRLRNVSDGGAGVRATIGSPGRELRLAGWVNWRQPFVYVSVTAARSARLTPAGTADPFRPGQRWAGPGPVEGLVQAVPGVVATRPGSHAANPGKHATNPGKDAADPRQVAVVDTRPPRSAPTDGWQVRRMQARSAASAPLDALAALLFTVASDRPDAADALARSGARWLRRDMIDGVPVDVVLGPAVPPAAPATQNTTPSTQNSTQKQGGQSPQQSRSGSLAAMGGAVRYWLDGRARVHRLEALLAPDLPARVDLLRDDKAAPPAIPALGGHPIAPREVSRREAVQLARMRQRNRATGGGRITLVLPDRAGTSRATGWVDWRTTAAYLRLTGPGHPPGGTLVRADRYGTATRPASGRNDRPPLPPPTGGWRLAPWSAGGDAQGAFDLELLLNELLALSAPERDPVRVVRARAARLRADELRNRPVAVYEVPKLAERGVGRGQARMRYWLGRDGVLRRLELRTRGGGFAQLDVVPGRVPPLPMITAAGGAPVETHTSRGRVRDRGGR